MPALPPEVWRKKWLNSVLNYSGNVKALFRNDPCSFCGGPGGTLDHIHPRPVINGHARGNFMNYTGACYDCNFEKGSDPHFLAFYARKQGKPLIGHTHNPGFRG